MKDICGLRLTSPVSTVIELLRLGNKIEHGKAAIALARMCTYQGLSAQLDHLKSLSRAPIARQRLETLLEHFDLL